MKNDRQCSFGKHTERPKDVRYMYVEHSLKPLLIKKWWKIKNSEYVCVGRGVGGRGVGNNQLWFQIMLNLVVKMEVSKLHLSQSPEGENLDEASSATSLD